MIALKNQTIVITGASSGIGAALAKLLAARGVNMVLNARSSRRLLDVKAACKALGAEVEAVAGDASDPRVAKKLVELATKIHYFVGFIHAAGVLHPGPAVWELDDASFAEVMDASVTAAHQLIRHAVPPLLKEGGGLAVFFGSGAAEKTQPGIGSYCAAKAAEEHLARQLAVEAPDILTVIWRPGIVEGTMQRQARESEGACAEQLQSVFRPWKEQGMLITPEESALGLIEFLEDRPENYHGRVADIRTVNLRKR
ncbi:SDR family NAD(P)-dependent oxidoreductase [Salidesulfovibrio brasiliensis]